MTKSFSSGSSFTTTYLEMEDMASRYERQLRIYFISSHRQSTRGDRSYNLICVSYRMNMQHLYRIWVRFNTSSCSLAVLRREWEWMRWRQRNSLFSWQIYLETKHMCDGNNISSGTTRDLWTIIITSSHYLNSRKKKAGLMMHKDWLMHYLPLLLELQPSY
jgi:hypothetical protein